MKQPIDIIESLKERLRKRIFYYFYDDENGVPFYYRWLERFLWWILKKCPKCGSRNTRYHFLTIIEFEDSLDIGECYSCGCRWEVDSLKRYPGKKRSERLRIREKIDEE